MLGRLFGRGEPDAARLVDEYVDKALSARGMTPYAWAIEHLHRRPKEAVWAMHRSMVLDWDRHKARLLRRFPTEAEAVEALRRLGQALNNASPLVSAVEPERLRLQSYAQGAQGPFPPTDWTPRDLHDMAARGLRLTDPGDAELLGAVERAIAAVPLRHPDWFKARYALAAIGGRAPPGEAAFKLAVEAEFGRFMDEATGWLGEVNAWRDRVAADPEAAQVLSHGSVPVAVVMGLDPPDGMADFLAARGWYGAALHEVDGETHADWVLAPLFENPELRLLDRAGFAALAQHAADWYRRNLGLFADAPPGKEADPTAALTAHLARASGAAPSAKWLKTASALGAALPAAEAREALLRPLRALPTLATLQSALKCWPEVERYELLWKSYESAFAGAMQSVVGSMMKMERSGFGLAPRYDPINFGPIAAPLEVSNAQVALLKGAAWALSAHPDAEAVDALERTARLLLVKIPGAGSAGYLSLAAANACVWSLGRIGTTAAVGALGRIKRTVRDERLAERIGKAMTEAAEAAGVAVADLEELAAPDGGLDEVGRAERRFGEHVVSLTVERGRARLGYATAGGKALKGPPTALKGDGETAEAFAELKAAAKEIEGALPLMRQRLEDSYLSGRNWAWDDWRTRWLDHPVAGTLARRLIWRLDDAGRVRQAAWYGERLVGLDGREAEPAAGTRVRLWHPLMSEGAEIAAWRAWLAERRITQPFAQAHRQLYLLTPAERETATYSNRFAGHILRQHQYMALAKSRGWSCRHRMWVDAPNDEPTYRRLPERGLYAEWWIAAPPGDAPEVSDNLAYTYVHSDRLSFRRLDAERRLRGEPVTLEDVDQLVLSEVMREVDLCVSVASIGNDPTWVDRGADALRPNAWREGAMRYWEAQANSPLDAASKVRAEVLAEILPQLALRDRFEIEGSRLKVQGKLARYLVHIGSGNVIMEPSQRYLCIVPAAGGDDALHLPFEGDRMLSVVISKALMLATDDKITDPGIRAQIRSGLDAG